MYIRYYCCCSLMCDVCIMMCVCVCVCDSSDLVEGLVLLMNSNYSQPVNIGNPDEYTILDFAENIISSIG